MPTLVVQYDEHLEYMKLYDNPYHFELCVLPEHIADLTSTRDWLIHERQGSNKVVFLDDDLNFAVRRFDDPGKFRGLQKPTDLVKMFARIEAGLDKYPMVGVGAREGGNRITDPFLFNTRIMRVLAFDRTYLRECAITFAPLKVMEDFHVNLQILRSGAETMVCNSWVSNQAGGSDAPGGCSVYRTSGVQTASAHLLQSLHPDFVTVVEKTTKGAWGGGTRTDVRIQWKKAYESSKSSTPSAN